MLELLKKRGTRPILETYVCFNYKLVIFVVDMHLWNGIMSLALLYKQFIQAGEKVFLGADASTASAFRAAKNSCLQGRVRYPLLKMHLQGRVTPSPAPTNPFSGARP